MGCWEQQQLKTKFVKLIHVAGIYKCQILEGVLGKLQAPENGHNSSLNAHFVCEQPVMILINIAKVLNIYMEFFFNGSF